MRNIIVYDSSTYIINRLKVFLSEKDYQIYEARDTKELQSYLSYRSIEIDIILADLEHKDDEEKKMLKDFISTHGHIPLIVFTAAGTKDTILEGVKIGATDFILKSISGDELEQRLEKIIHNGSKSFMPTLTMDEEHDELEAQNEVTASLNIDGSGEKSIDQYESQRRTVSDVSDVVKQSGSAIAREIVQKINKRKSERQHDDKVDNKSVVGLPSTVIVNLQKFLAGEIKKAEKGNYKLTVSFSDIKLENYNINTSVKVAELINEIFDGYWDTDFLIPYGMHRFVSFFPFCDEKMINLLDDKLQQTFNEKKLNHSLEKGILKNSYITYPTEGISKEKIIAIIEKKMASELKE